ncbi:MAG: hypothetical protein AUH29_03850 [Candidatus Rokubacteria bacterium 13_1_40CM_69_27]|nr:MAG: hypothetical protein AUH29_03850 [Candidatus Rokubacteria bacterium 13_1_40CM_69_27]
MSDLLTRRRFTVEEYHRMGSAEILAKDEPVELIAGEIVVREPIGSRHAGTVNHLTHLWTWRLGERAVVQIQNPIEFLKEDSEPQPDVTLLRPRADSYRAAHPVAADVLLLVEVADGSLAVDRRVRMPLYARAGIREAWLLDLTADRVEVYRAPTADSYQHVVYHVGELVGDRRVLLTAESGRERVLHHRHRLVVQHDLVGDVLRRPSRRHEQGQHRPQHGMAWLHRTPPTWRGRD